MKEKQTLKKGYWVVAYRSVLDPEALAAYAGVAKPAIEGLGGRFVVRGLPAEVQGVGLIERTTVIEFPSLKQAIAAYHSEAYREALTVFKDAAERDFRIVEGVE